MWRQGPFVRDVDDISVAAKEKRKQVLGRLAEKAVARRLVED